jgi:hypothetical protein
MIPGANSTRSLRVKDLLPNLLPKYQAYDLGGYSSENLILMTRSSSLHPTGADEQFRHVDAKYPGVIYEIACSQSGKDLDKAAWAYIPYSNGDIKAVIGFELGYGESKEARVSLWRPHYEKGDNGPLDTLGVNTVVDRMVGF